MTDPPETLVIGAGPAGLAVGACLSRAGLPVEILEQYDTVGASWRHHYERLHLHTHKAISKLPFRSFPKDYPRYVSRDQFIRYLEDYARTLGLTPRFGERVMSARRENGRWTVRTEENSYAAENLVVATGFAREPVIPVWPGLRTFPGAIVHSAHYADGTPYRGQRMLVVGFGNSGGEIAMDLCAYAAEVFVAVRHPTNVIPRDLLGIPIMAFAATGKVLPARVADALSAPLLRAIYRDLPGYGVRRPDFGPISQTEFYQKTPLIDIGTVDLIRRGKIKVRGGIVRFEGRSVVFDDGARESVDAVILATGFRPRVDAFLDDPDVALDANGAPATSGTPVPGLYFCGFFVSPTGMFPAIGREAKRIARDIRRSARTSTRGGTHGVSQGLP